MNNDQRATKVLLIASVMVNLLLLGLLFTHYPSSFYAKFVSKPENEIKYSLELFGFHYLPETNEPKVAVIGDSIVRGANLTSLLKRNDIVNRGIAGDLSIWMSQRIKFLLAKKPGFIVIQGGINDVNEKVPVKQIFDSKVLMVKFCKDNNIVPILIEVLPVTEKPDVKLSAASDEINRNVQNLNHMLNEYAKKNNIAYVRMTEGLTTGIYLTQALSRDGVHLTDQGYSIFANNLQTMFKSLGI